MRNYIFSGTIDLENVNKLIDFLNIHQHEEVNLYFSSGGGQTGLAMFLAEAINTRSSAVYVHLGDDLHSSAFMFAYALKGNIVFNPFLQTYSIIHACSANVTSQMPERLFSLESIDNSNEVHIEAFSFLTLAERIAFKEGKDVHLNYTRLKQIFHEKIVNS